MRLTWKKKKNKRSVMKTGETGQTKYHYDISSKLGNISENMAITVHTHLTRTPSTGLTRNMLSKPSLIRPSVTTCATNRFCGCVSPQQHWQVWLFGFVSARRVKLINSRSTLTLPPWLSRGLTVTVRRWWCDTFQTKYLQTNCQFLYSAHAYH